MNKPVVTLVEEGRVTGGTVFAVRREVGSQITLPEVVTDLRKKGLNVDVLPEHLARKPAPSRQIFVSLGANLTQEQWDHIFKRE